MPDQFVTPERVLLPLDSGERLCSDGAGFVIRNYLKGAIDPKLVKHAYIPEIKGKERRKAAPSKEGTLGVEGMKPQVIEEALLRAGVTLEDKLPQQQKAEITKADLFALGLSGGGESSQKRRELQKRLGLPEKLSANLYSSHSERIFPI